MSRRSETSPGLASCHLGCGVQHVPLFEVFLLGHKELRYRVFWEGRSHWV